MLNSFKDFLVTIDAATTTFARFQQLVAAACENEFANTATLIEESIDTGTPHLDWIGSIPRVTGWSKSDGNVIANSNDYSSWLQAATTASKDTVSLALKMTNPSELIRQDRQADLLAQRARRAQEAREAAARRRRAGVSDDEVATTSDDDEEDRLNIKMKLLYSTHPINCSYDRKLPVFVNPSDPRKYIFLTGANCQEWARALLSYFFSFLFIYFSSCRSVVWKLMDG